MSAVQFVPDADYWLPYIDKDDGTQEYKSEDGRTTNPRKNKKDPASLERALELVKQGKCTGIAPIKDGQVIEHWPGGRPVQPPAQGDAVTPQQSAGASTEANPATPPPVNPNESPFEKVAYRYIERGYSVVPIAPGTKRPGQYSEADGWHGMHDWQRYNTRLPTEHELPIWYTWSGAGIGLLTGKLSRVVGVDLDGKPDTPYTKAVQALFPWTPVKKKGAKGYTAFYRYNGEKSCSFNAGGERVLDVLSDGRQTVMPGTQHPDGLTYIYLTEDRLEDYDQDDLPVLPDDFFDQVARALAPYQTVEDTKYQRKLGEPKQERERDASALSVQQQYFRDLKDQALARLDEWVPMLVPTARQNGDGYRCIATWRGVKNANVGIHPNGIMDFGGGYGLSPIDLVMHANGITLGQAVDRLRVALNLKEPEPIAITVGGSKPTTLAAPIVYCQDLDPPVGNLPEVHNETGVAAEFPVHLLKPGGVLSGFMDWILGCAQKPQPILALATALSIVATVLARKVRTQTGLRTNVYLVSVAGTGAGKDHGRKCLKVAFHYAGLDSLVGGEEIASGKGLLAAAYRQPASVFQIDEFGLMLKTVRGKNAGSHLQEIVTNLMKLFSTSGAVYYGTEYADQKMRPRQDIPYPCINLNATTTPEPLFESFASSDVASGYINRLLILFAPNQKGPMRFTDIDPPPQTLLDWMKAARDLTQGQLLGTLPDQPIVIRMSEGATKLFTELHLFHEEQVEKKQSIGLGDLWSRCWEHASKIALVVACARIDDPKRLATLIEQGQVVIDEDSALWAIEFVKHVIGRMETEILSRVADSEFGQLVQVTHQVILKAGKRGLTERELGRACRKYDGLRPFDRDAVLETLKRKGEVVSIAFQPASGRGRCRSAWVSTKFYDQDGIVVGADE